MLISFAAGWLFGSLTLYTYFVLTAKEPPYKECMDCRANECDECNIPEGTIQESQEGYDIAA